MDRATCRRFIERWREVAQADPSEGDRHAERCLDLVADLGHPSDLHARALTIYGSSRREAGDFEGADEAFQCALRIYSSLLRSPDHRELVFDKADLTRRIAYLRAEQGRYKEALNAADWALDIYSIAKDWHEYSRALLARGIVLLMSDDSRSTSVLSLTLRHLDAEKSWEDFLAAAYNLTYALTIFEDIEPEKLEGILDQLTETRLSLRSLRRKTKKRYLKGHRRKTPHDALMRFLQGRILVLLERYEEARDLLESSRQDLEDLGMLRDVAAASLELAECTLNLSGIHRWHRTEALCREVLTLLASEPDGIDAIAAFKLLKRSLLERSLEEARTALLEARQAIRGSS